MRHLLIILLLLSCTVISLFAQVTATVDSLKNSPLGVMNRKAAEYAKQFGFEGEIKYDSDNTRFISLMGMYYNIDVTDTLSAVETASKLIQDLIPYFGVNKDQLAAPVCNEAYMYFAVKFVQQINGIGFEAPANITFFFYNDENKVLVESGIYPNLNFPVTGYISREKAINTYTTLKGKNNLSEMTADMMICPLYKPDLSAELEPRSFRVCWVIIVRNYKMYIDALTGKIIGKGIQEPFD